MKVIKTNVGVFLVDSKNLVFFNGHPIGTSAESIEDTEAIIRKKYKEVSEKQIDEILKKHF